MSNDYDIFDALQSIRNVLIDIRDRLPEPKAASTRTCEKCGHEWYAIYPASVLPMDLECPECHYHRPSSPCAAAPQEKF